MLKSEVDLLDPGHSWWVPVVVSPERDWPGAPGCRRGARFLVDADTFRASRDAFKPFETQLGCMEWIMRHRMELNAVMPRTSVRAVRLDRWLLGLE